MSRQQIAIHQLGHPGPVYIDGPCYHDAEDVVPVESVTGEVVAHLCTGCDTQLPAAYQPRPAFSYLLPPAFTEALREAHDLIGYT